MTKKEIEALRWLTKDKLLDEYNKYCNRKRSQKRAEILMKEIKRRKLPVGWFYNNNGRFLTWTIFQFKKKKDTP